jgi:phage FluMu protein Com
MARNRIIKPEFWADAKVGRLSFGARLLYIAMWNFADDYGIISASPRKLLGDAFENDESVNIDDVNKFLSEIEQQGQIKRYCANEKEWFEIVHFTDHQRISHKSTRVNPQPSSGDSPATLRQHTGSNVNDNGNGNVNGNENGNGSGEQNKLPPSTEPNDQLTPEWQLYANACACFGASPDPFLTDSNKRLLRLIRGDVRVGADKFIKACENRARAPDVPGKIAVEFFLDDFKWQSKIIEWAKGVPQYGKFSDKKSGGNYTARDANKGDGAGWDHKIKHAGT